MTDPSTRGAKYALRFAWLFAVTTAVCIAGSILAISLGSRTGWLTLALSATQLFLSIIWFRLYLRLREQERNAERDAEHPDA